MASCAYCGTTILFGGKREGDLRFCNEECRQKGQVSAKLSAIAQQVPDHIVTEQSWKVHLGACPKCGGGGPVDVHTSYRVWSALYVTSWRTRTHVVCRRCGSKARLGDAAFCLAFGWWGFPWGFIMTPVQVFRNVAGIFRAPDSTTPSPQLARLVRLQMAAHALESSRQ